VSQRRDALDADLARRIDEMIAGLAGCPPLLLPSKYWEHLNTTTMAELRKDGYENFKRTLATHYFTFLLTPADSQIRFLLRNVDPWTVVKAAVATVFAPTFPPLPFLQSRSYAFITHLLWAYASKVDEERLLSRLVEPSEGNPPRVVSRGRLISQDLANSTLEFISVMSSGVDRGEVGRILELGAGYGRTAAVFLSLLPEMKYVVVDIPPALAVSERYLTSLFSDRKVFRYRPFRSYDEVREELEAADIAFLLPQQLELLPDQSIDLFLNISSLHEMRIEQIRAYFGILQRLVRHAAYLKQWRVSKIPYDDVVITENDYPIPATWKTVYHRVCAVQVAFFEALYRVEGGGT
jgi:putative sugar O-methyltransferase